MKQKKYAKMFYPSPIGTLSLVADEQYLYGIWVQDQTHFERGIDADMEVVTEHPVLDQVISYLDAYFDARVQDLSLLPLAPIGTDFEKRVWAYLQAIPYGQTVTYGQIAQDLQVASAQAIGGAVGRNPWSILVPCHRVLGSGNRLTGYASGVEKKAWLLQHEGADFKDIK
ncbi:methylated-DNA--[protein]-cysteine S-methyltransferase [Streptococcus sp. 5905]|uniref:methylated-DNA--[protein]-cysteine S-methyltransferase n=1 Tax=Streptococcus sp. 5905 TaxID=2582683 RepID=UPI0015655536|nr:methylated-DNA--[protein]-cysteine S-methyltransferase [Streptococcus sp. 5905]